MTGLAARRSSAGDIGRRIVIWGQPREKIQDPTWKITEVIWAWYLIPVIPEAEIGKIVFLDQPRQKVSETLNQQLGVVGTCGL
jgi:hypothetical protein